MSPHPGSVLSTSPSPWRFKALVAGFVVALLAGALAFVSQRPSEAAPHNIVWVLPDAFLVGAETGQAAFADGDILAASPGQPALSTYRFENAGWVKVAEIDLVASLGLSTQDGLNIDGIGVDGSTATVTLNNGTDSRQIVLKRDTAGTWNVTDSFDVMSKARISGDTIAGIRGPWIDVMTNSAAGWTSTRLTSGNLRDIEGDWIALTHAGTDELWHRSGGTWAPAQQLGPRTDGLLIDGDTLIRSLISGVTETWQLQGDIWTLINTQTLEWGYLTHFEDGSLLIQTTPAGQVNPTYGSFYELSAAGTWELRYSNLRLARIPATSNPSIDNKWILGLSDLWAQRATYARDPYLSPPTTNPETTTTAAAVTTTTPSPTATSPSTSATTSSSSTAPTTTSSSGSNSTVASSTTAAPPVTSTTHPSGPPPSGGVPCAGLNTLHAQGSFVPKAYWSVLPQYLDGSDTTARMVATHLDCTSDILNPSTATAVFKFQDVKFTAGTFTSVTKTYNQIVVTGTGTIRGDSTLYGYELTIINKGDSRDLTDYYKIKIYAPNQTAPTIVIKGPVRGHKITTT